MPSTLTVSPETVSEVDRALASGHPAAKIHAIRTVLNRSARPQGLGLRESRDWVDAYVAGRNPRTAEVVAREIVEAHARLHRLYHEFDLLADREAAAGIPVAI